MAKSVVDICSISLINIGMDPITSLSDDTDPARACNRLYESTRDAVLRAHPWNCALIRASLSRLVSVPAWGFSFQYQLPPDCLRVLQMEDEDSIFKIEARLLLTDEDAAKVLYISRVEDPVQYDSLLYTTIAARLSAELSGALPGRIDLMQNMWQLYSAKLQEARSMDGQEGTPTQFASNELTDVR